MDQAQLENLALAAASGPTPKALSALLEAVKGAGSPVSNETNQALNLLYEAINEEMLDPAQAGFFMELAALSVADGPRFRLLLVAAVKQLLPPYLNHNPILRALGLRDESVPVSHVVGRFKKLSLIKTGIILFLNNTGRWGSVNNIDNISGSVALNPFGADSSKTAIPLDLVLVSGVLLASGIEVIKIADRSGRTKMSSNEFRAIVRRKAITPVTDQHIQSMAKAGLGAKMSPDDLETWYGKDELVAGLGVLSQRRSCNGRSLQEVLILLEGEGNERFSDEEAMGFGKFFVNLKDDVIRRELKNLGEVLVKVSERATDEQLGVMLDSMKTRLPFWPADPMRCDYNSIAVWSDFAAKDIERLASITHSIFPGSYLAACSMRLPLKALNSIGGLTPINELDQILLVQRNYTADLGCWIWKNRAKGSQKLLKHLGIDNIIRALSQENLPKAWTAAMRELKMLLLDNAEFQKFLIKSSGDPLKLITALQGALFLSGGERQSLSVKLARYSDELRSQLESGAGAKILQAGTSAREQQQALADENANQPHYTSAKAHRALLKELEDIVNIHKPENRESLKTARARGDFRENAEFDAAKERRNFLSHRQGELEKELLLVQSVDLRKAIVKETAIIGCSIDFKDDTDTVKSYYLLGAWDGNPDKGYLSYRTRLGEVLLGRKVGDTITIPGDRKATITAIKPLPEDVLKDLE